MTPLTQTVFADDPRGIPGDCMRTAVASLLELPPEAVPHFALFERDWFSAFSLWMTNHQLALSPQGDESEPHLALGLSPRGVQHIVIWANGECIHDPHPSRAGLQPERYWWIGQTVAIP